jgi:hypothetical protein
MAKRTYPWLLATVAAADNFPSPLARRDADTGIPVAKKRRVMAPYSANPEDSNVTKTSSTDAEKAVRPADADADADPMTAMQQLKYSAKRAPPSALTLQYDKQQNGRRRNHNRYNEYKKEWPAVASVAPASTNM